MANNNEQTYRRQLSMYDYFPELNDAPFDEDDIPEAVLDMEAAEEYENLLTREYDANTSGYKNKLMHFAITINYFAENNFKIKTMTMN